MMNCLLITRTYPNMGRTEKTSPEQTEQTSCNLCLQQLLEEGTGSFLTWEERLTCPWAVCLNGIIINSPGQTVPLSSQDQGILSDSLPRSQKWTCDLPDSPNRLLWPGLQVWQILLLFFRVPSVILKESDSKPPPVCLLTSLQLHTFFCFHCPSHDLCHHYLGQPIALLFGFLASTLAPFMVISPCRNQRTLYKSQVPCCQSKPSNDFSAYLGKHVKFFELIRHSQGK